MPVLDWLGKDKVINHHRDAPFHFLDKKFSVGASDNKIIHGDNLLALKSLLPEFVGKVKCIYIDPPYNTGNEGWIYNDAVNNPHIKCWLGQVVGREGEDLTRHDKWLCMMYPRLRLLQRLLSDNGAIFISIDDNEQANLKLICDEIFGAQNFIAQLVWEKKRKGAFLSKTVTNVKEYIIVYCKAIDSFGGLIGEVKRSPETYPCINAINKRELRIIPRGVKSRYKDKNFFLAAGTRILNSTMDIVYLTDLVIENGVVVKDFAVDGNWRYSQDLMTKFASDGELFITSGLHLRRIIDAPRIKMLKDLLLRTGSDGKAESSFTYDENLNNGGWGTNEDANEELHKIFGKQYVFDFAKPSRLIGKLIQSATDKDSLILDSFAGSGTTAHAVINLNAQDGGNRCFILIELMDYAESITAERVRRVGGSFDFYELGEPLFDDDGFINKKIDREKIFDYIYFSETGKHYAAAAEEFLLGVDEGIAYYYFPDSELNYDLLATIRTRAAAYVIYADNCTLSENFLDDWHITFKKIPNDIRRY